MAKDMQTGGGAVNIVFGVKNILIGFALTIAILFIAAWIAVLTNLQEAAVSLVVGVVTYLCVGFCGFRAARKSGSNGLVSGAIAGAVYVVLLYFIGCIAFADFSFGMSVLLTAVICILCGAIGGVVGVNTRTKRRR